MKQNIKVFLTALVIGMVCAFLVCYKFDPTIVSRALESRVTYFYIGTYNNEAEALSKQNSYPDSIIYNSNGLYQVIIGVYSNKDTLELMESYFLDNNIVFRKKELKVDNVLLRNMKNYELLITSSEKEYYKDLNNSLLKLFKDYIK